MRSVDVVLPASMCAMIPMLRVCSSLNARAIFLRNSLFLAAICYCLNHNFNLLTTTASSNRRFHRQILNAQLPAIVREGLVRFRHAVHVFFLLHRSAAPIGGVHQFFRQLVDHRLAARVRANTAAASESPATAAGTDSLPPAPDSSRRQRAATSLPAPASRSRRPS